MEIGGLWLGDRRVGSHRSQGMFGQVIEGLERHSGECQPLCCRQKCWQGFWLKDDSIMLNLLFKKIFFFWSKFRLIQGLAVLFLYSSPAFPNINLWQAGVEWSVRQLTLMQSYRLHSDVANCLTNVLFLVQNVIQDPTLIQLSCLFRLL